MDIKEIMNISNIINGVIASIVAAGVISPVIWLWKKISGKVIINRIDVRNVPKTFQGNALPVLNDLKKLKNYVENEIIINNNKDNVLISDLVIEVIKVSKYFYEDILIQRGFNMPKQIVDFVVFNNGNITSKSRCISARVYYINKKDDEVQTIETLSLNQEALKKGEIRIIFSKNLSDPRLLNYFSNNLPDYKQSIKLDLIDDIEDKVLSTIEIPYLSSNKMFVLNLGGSAPVDRTLIPIVELYQPYNQLNFSFRINQVLSDGINQIRFNILVDAPCQIKYSVKLIDNKSKIVSKYVVDTLNIRFPNYHLTSQYNDDMFIFYLLMKFLRVIMMTCI